MLLELLCAFALVNPSGGVPSTCDGQALLPPNEFVGSQGCGVPLTLRLAQSGGLERGT